MKQAIWMVLASLCFSAMGVCIKFATSDFGIAELIAYRGGLSAIIVYGMMRWRGESIRTPYPVLHVQRSVIGVLSLATWFYAISGLPLSTAMTLNYMSSIWLAAFLIGGAFLLRFANTSNNTISNTGANSASAPTHDFDIMNSAMIATVVIGFAGVGLILRPTIEQNQLWYGFVGLLSGIGAAVAYMQVAALGRVGEPELRIVFYFSIGATLVGLIGTLFDGFTALSWRGIGWLVPMALLAVGGQVLMTRAYSQGATITAACLQYSGVLFGAIFGVWIFDDALNWQSWLGMVMIVMSGIFATALGMKRFRP